VANKDQDTHGWYDYFTVRYADKLGYYASWRGKPLRVSPIFFDDFIAAKSWIKRHWKEVLDKHFETEVLGAGDESK
jgi:hypothetical protein